MHRIIQRHVSPLIVLNRFAKSYACKFVSLNQSSYIFCDKKIWEKVTYLCRFYKFFVNKYTSNSISTKATVETPTIILGAIMRSSGSL